MALFDNILGCLGAAAVTAAVTIFVTECAAGVTI